MPSSSIPNYSFLSRVLTNLGLCEMGKIGGPCLQTHSPANYTLKIWFLKFRLVEFTCLKVNSMSLKKSHVHSDSKSHSNNDNCYFFCVRSKAGHFWKFCSRVLEINNFGRDSRVSKIAFTEKILHTLHDFQLPAYQCEPDRHSTQSQTTLFRPTIQNAVIPSI